MRILLKSFLILLALGSSSFLHAQEVTVWYEIIRGGTSETVRLYLSNNTSSNIELGAVNLSSAYIGSQSAYSTINFSLFDNTWGSASGNIAVQAANTAFLPKSYGGPTYDVRTWYLASMPATGPMAVPLVLVPSPIPVLALELVYTTGSAGEYYVETATEFPGNGMTRTSLAPVVFDVQDFATFPVEWVDFTATPIRENTVQLDWTTATEQNNAGFEIERSVDALHFELIGEMKGAGTTSSPTSYTYLDEKAKSPVLFYRLRQVDFNGSFSYSEIREVHMGDQFALSFSVFPNPTSEFLSLRIESDLTQKFDFRLSDLNGKTIQRVKQLELGPQDHKINVANLPQGVYSVELVKEESGEIFSRLFIKE